MGAGQASGLPCALHQFEGGEFLLRNSGARRGENEQVCRHDRRNGFACLTQERVAWTPTPALCADPSRKGEGEAWTPHRPTLHAVVIGH